MAKILVVYYSESGNTEKVARVIAEKTEANLRKIEEVRPEEINSYDLMFIGTPVHGFAPAKEVKKFLDKLPEISGGEAAAFCTMHIAGDKRTFKKIKEKLEAKKITYLGSFSCLGLSRLIGNFGPRIFNKGRPNEEDLKKAGDFGKRILAETEKLKVY